MSLKKFQIAPGPLLILLSNLCFCTTGTAQALAPEGASAPVVGALRLLIGGMAMLGWCAATGKLPRRTGWPWAKVLLAGVSLVAFQVCFFLALRKTGVAVGTMVCAGSVPIMGGLFSWIFFKEKPSRLWYPATLAAVAGVVLLSITGPLRVEPLGLVLALTATLFYLGNTMTSKSLARNHPPETVMCVLFLMAGLLSLPIFFMFPVDWLFSGRGMLVALHLGVVTAALAYTLNLAGLKITPTPTAMTLVLTDPFGAALLGFFLLGEPATPPILLGMCLIFISMAVLSVTGRAREAKLSN